MALLLFEGIPGLEMFARRKLRRKQFLAEADERMPQRKSIDHCQEIHYATSEKRQAITNKLFVVDNLTRCLCYQERRPFFLQSHSCLISKGKSLRHRNLWQSQPLVSLSALDDKFYCVERFYCEQRNSEKEKIKFRKGEIQLKLKN